MALAHVALTRRLHARWPPPLTTLREDLPDVAPMASASFRAAAEVLPMAPFVDRSQTARCPDVAETH
jgi:hypothetical protein